MNSRDVRRRDGHQLSRDGLVAAAEEHDGIHGLGGELFLELHRHQIAEQHGRGMGEDLAQRHHRKDEREATGLKDAALNRLDQPGHLPVAGGVVGGGVDDSDDGAIYISGIQAGGVEEGPANESAETRVAVVGEPTVDASGGRLVLVAHSCLTG